MLEMDEIELYKRLNSSSTRSRRRARPPPKRYDPFSYSLDSSKSTLRDYKEFEVNHLKIHYEN